MRIDRPNHIELFVPILLVGFSQDAERLILLNGPKDRCPLVNAQRSPGTMVESTMYPRVCRSSFARSTASAALLGIDLRNANEQRTDTSMWEAPLPSFLGMFASGLAMMIPT